MNAPRLMTIALLIAAMSTVSCGVSSYSKIAPITERHTVVLDSDSIAAARVLGNLHTGLLPDEISSLAATIVTETRRATIPIDLVLALIQVESSGNAFAVSSVGAIGLMQLRPSTAEEVAGALGIRWTGASALFDPEMNVRLGVEYLRQLIDRYGSIPTALAAYNWGPGRIGGKLRRGEAIPAAYSGKILAIYTEPLSSAI